MPGGRTGEVKGTATGWWFEPDVTESQSDTDNDAEGEQT